MLFLLVRFSVCSSIDLCERNKRLAYSADFWFAFKRFDYIRIYITKQNESEECGAIAVKSSLVEKRFRNVSMW